jgi:hypothetical protein
MIKVTLAVAAAAEPIDINLPNREEPNFSAD